MRGTNIVFFCMDSCDFLPKGDYQWPMAIARVVLSAGAQPLCDAPKGHSLRDLSENSRGGFLPELSGYCCGDGHVLSAALRKEKEPTGRRRLFLDSKGTILTVAQG